MKYISLTIGRFQPFTQGHLNMCLDAKEPVIIYKINSSNNDGPIKIKGKLAKKSQIQHALDYVDSLCETKLTEDEKEILKRPFTNELIEKELDIVKKNNKNIIDVIYVKNVFDALDRFNKFCNENKEYTPHYLMCGDDRAANYQSMLSKLDKYSELETEIGSKQYLPNIIAGKLETNIGSGRQEGLSGTAVRECIIKKDRKTFEKQMPHGVDTLFDDFMEAFDSFVEKLRIEVKEAKEYISLEEYIVEHNNVVFYNKYSPISLQNYINIYEGGQAGHMPHPYDYTDWTANDLINLIKDLFSGKVEHLKEKLDGMNIMASMNNDGEVIFIRNNSNLNSERGGMSIEEMAEKWSNKEHQRKVFTQAGKIITDIFKKLPISYFNPSNNVRKVINCECIVAGKTNIMPYISDRVAFHGYKLYKLQDNGKYSEIKDVEGDVDEIYKATDGIESAKPRPDLVIKYTEKANELSKRFVEDIKEIFKNEKLSLDVSINDWKFARFNKLKPDWIKNDESELAIFNRWFNNDKSYKATQLKKDYPANYNEIMDNKIAKQFVSLVMDPLDTLFLEIGNEFIDLLDGFVNSKNHDNVCTQLKKDLEDTITTIEKSNSDIAKEKILKNMDRFAKLNNKYNSAEGVVITYKGRRLKLTGSFAVINQILGTRFDLEENNK
jgi:hypothetical protein